MININEDMENMNNEFTESLADAVFEGQQSAFYMHAIDAPGPDEDEKDEEDEEDENVDDEDSSESSKDNDPPLDDDVVHSPVTPQTGGKPGVQQENIISN